MDTSSIENLKIVRASNQDMLDYFNSLYVRKLEMVQSLKTEQFELKVKIDELVKTLDVYSFKNSSGHNVFSPFSSGTTIQQEKASQIESQIRDLMDVQLSIDGRITKLENEIDDLKKRINTLSTSNKKLNELLTEAEEKPDTASEYEEDEETEENDEPDINHGLNILRLQDYGKQKLADKLENQIADILDGNIHKLEVLSWLLKSDINRAKLTLEELISSNEKLLEDVDGLISDLTYNFDSNEPVWTLLDDIMLEYKESHPECVIESDVECPDYELNLPPIITSNLIMIIREIMENAFKHSNANRIVVKIYISSRLIDVFINDNGVGIDSNFSHVTPWYSGLNRIREIIYLLGGQFKIDGDIISGTNVRFSFPIDKPNS
ncbi:MAG: ATP-binding protein [Coprococcus sp.]|nr:ATP-binding protein [Coprococcus sp.]